MNGCPCRFGLNPNSGFRSYLLKLARTQPLVMEILIWWCRPIKGCLEKFDDHQLLLFEILPLLRRREQETIYHQWKKNLTATSMHVFLSPFPSSQIKYMWSSWGLIDSSKSYLINEYGVVFRVERYYSQLNTNPFINQDKNVNPNSKNFKPLNQKGHTRFKLGWKVIYQLVDRID